MTSVSPAYEDILHMLDIIETNSVRRLSITFAGAAKPPMDWVAYRETVMSGVALDISQEDSEIVMKKAIRLLDDNHSRYIGRHIETSELTNDCIEKIESRLLGQTGYLSIPEFVAFQNPEYGQLFTDKILSSIYDLEGSGARDWIIDLRKNHGGNMWPMLAGLIPLIGNEIHGYFLSGNGDIPWSPMENPPPILNNHKKLKIGVLLGENTASSGEAICIALKGLPNVTTFGQPTAGLTTANNIHILKDGQRLFILASGIMADRHKNPYGYKIQPDITVEGAAIGADPENDSLITYVREWLKGAPQPNLSLSP